MGTVGKAVEEGEGEVEGDRLNGNCALRVVSVAKGTLGPGRGVRVRQLFEVCPNKRRQLAHPIWFQNKGLRLHTVLKAQKSRNIQKLIHVCDD